MVPIDLSYSLSPLLLCLGDFVGTLPSTDVPSCGPNLSTQTLFLLQEMSTHFHSGKRS